MKIRLSNVQALRACAALIVVLNHLPDEEAKILGHRGLLGGLGAFGAGGVDLFFVISGFIMTVTMWEGFGRKRAAPNFLSRRALRIFPMYLLAIAVFIVDRHFEHRDAGFGGWNILSTLTLLPTGHGIPFGVAWSLQFEMFFYYLFAIALCFDRKRLPIFAGLWFALTLVCNAIAGSQPILAFVGSPLAFEFMGGMLVGFFSVRGQFLAPRICIAVGALAFFASCLRFMPYDGLDLPAQVWQRALTAGVASIVLLYGAVGSEHRFKLLAPKALVDLGDSSYSLYLMHGFIIGIVADVFVRLHHGGLAIDIAYLVAAYLAVWFGAIAIYRFVERPIMLAVKKYTSVKPLSHGVDEKIAPSVA